MDKLQYKLRQAEILRKDTVRISRIALDYDGGVIIEYHTGEVANDEFAIQESRTVKMAKDSLPQEVLEACSLLHSAAFGLLVLHGSIPAAGDIEDLSVKRT
jgi:hypothetical protein